MLDKIGAEITGFSKMFPVEASLANFTIFLNERHKLIESYYPQMDQMDFYRFVYMYIKNVIKILRKYEHSSSIKN